MNSIKTIEVGNFISRLREYQKDKSLKIRPDDYGNINFLIGLTKYSFNLQININSKRNSLNSYS